MFIVLLYHSHHVHPFIHMLPNLLNAARQCITILANVIQMYVTNSLYVVLQCTTNYDYGYTQSSN